MRGSACNVCVCVGGRGARGDSQMEEQGLRVLALAVGRSTETMTLVGLVGIVDPPREGIDKSVSLLKKGS